MVANGSFPAPEELLRSTTCLMAQWEPSEAPMLSMGVAHQLGFVLLAVGFIQHRVIHAQEAACQDNERTPLFEQVLGTELFRYRKRLPRACRPGCCWPCGNSDQASVSERGTSPASAHRVPGFTGPTMGDGLFRRSPRRCDGSPPRSFFSN